MDTFRELKAPKRGFSGWYVVTKNVPVAWLTTDGEITRDTMAKLVYHRSEDDAIEAIENYYNSYKYADKTVEDDLKDINEQPTRSKMSIKPFERLKEGDPTSFYWQAADILVKIGYHNFNRFQSHAGLYYLSNDTDAFPTKNELLEFEQFTENGFKQSDAIEGYIRDPKNDLELWEKFASEKNVMTELRGSEVNPAAMHHNRLDIILDCLSAMADEYITDEVRFNKMCIQIKDDYGIERNSDVPALAFNPYMDIYQLIRIVELIFEENGAGFMLLPNINIFQQLRNYACAIADEPFVKAP